MRHNFVYPATHQSDVVDDYHGTLVADPDRWLEDPDSPETRTWVTAQNALTRNVLGAIPARQHIEARFKALWDFPRWPLSTTHRPKTVPCWPTRSLPFAFLADTLDIPVTSLSRRPTKDAV